MSKQARMLKKILKAKSISQADLARRLRISPSHLCKVIAGERKLSGDKTFEASRILGVPMETFFQ